MVKYKTEDINTIKKRLSNIYGIANYMDDDEQFDDIAEQLNVVYDFVQKVGDDLKFLEMRVVKLKTENQELRKKIKRTKL